jgi:thymidine kinase
MSTTSNDLQVNSKTGYLELIFGPMWSGKTSTLLNYYRQFCFCKLQVCVINFKADDRYSETMLSTHDKQMIPCIMGFSIEEILQIPENAKKINESDVILINEGQFFHDIVEFATRMVEQQHKKIYICGLDGDFKREKIGKLIDLIPISDTVIKLHALCGKCKDGTRAPFSFRNSNSTKQVLIGADDIYVPLCRRCYQAELAKKGHTH